jgi:class 3 adenylate cyclase
MPTRNLSIMFTDIKGFTARTSEETRQGVVNLLAEHERLLLPCFRYFEGTVVKTIGDAFLVHFDSPTDAVLCGLTIQEVLRQHNSFVADKDKLEVRVAINSGDVELKDGDVLGEPVNLAARVEAITEAGEVWFTEVVYLSMNRKEVPSAEIGERTFKGIPYPVKVYRVVRDPNSEQARKLADAVRVTKDGPVFRGLRQPTARSRAAVAPLVGFVAIAALAVSAFVATRPTESEKALAKARELVAQDQSLSALEVLDAAIKKDPQSDALRVAAVETANAQLDRTIKERSRAVALEWLTKELEKKPYLEPLRKRVPVLETEHEMWEWLEGRSKFHQYEELVPELMRRFPDDPDVPHVIADLAQKQVIVEATLWLYERSIERGWKPDARVKDACLKTLERCGPDEPAYVKTADDLLAKHFGADRLAWARKRLDDGAVVPFENALAILDSSKDPAAQDPFWRALRATLAGEDVDESAKTLAGEKDPARRRRALALVKEAMQAAEARGGDAGRALAAKLQLVFEKLGAAPGDEPR